MTTVPAIMLTIDSGSRRIGLSIHFRMEMEFYVLQQCLLPLLSPFDEPCFAFAGSRFVDTSHRARLVLVLPYCTMEDAMKRCNRLHVGKSICDRYFNGHLLLIDACVRTWPKHDGVRYDTIGGLSLTSRIDDSDFIYPIATKNGFSLGNIRRCKTSKDIEWTILLHVIRSPDVSDDDEEEDVNETHESNNLLYACT